MSLRTASEVRLRAWDSKILPVRIKTMIAAAVSEAKLTVAYSTPERPTRAFSTVLTHAAQLIPRIGICTVSNYFSCFAAAFRRYRFFPFDFFAWAPLSSSSFFGSTMTGGCSTGFSSCSAFRSTKSRW